MMFKIEPFTEEQIFKLKELKQLYEMESGWNPPQEYLEEWIKVVLGVHNHDPRLVSVALIDNKVIGYCISVKRLHSYEGVVMDITWNSAYIWDFSFSRTQKQGNRHSPHQ
jgi:hypothetical protein